MEFNINQIMEMIPHRYPFLLVDRVVEMDYESDIKRIVAYKNVTINEPFFEGHFPTTPIMPGVLIVEAMARISCKAGAHHCPAVCCGAITTMGASVDRATAAT